MSDITINVINNSEKILSFYPKRSNKVSNDEELRGSIVTPNSYFSIKMEGTNKLFGSSPSLVFFLIDASSILPFSMNPIGFGSGYIKYLKDRMSITLKNRDIEKCFPIVSIDIKEFGNKSKLQYFKNSTHKELSYEISRPTDSELNITVQDHIELDKIPLIVESMGIENKGMDWYIHEQGKDFYIDIHEHRKFPKSGFPTFRPDISEKLWPLQSASYLEHNRRILDSLNYGSCFSEIAMFFINLLGTSLTAYGVYSYSPLKIKQVQRALNIVVINEVLYIGIMAQWDKILYYHKTKNTFFLLGSCISIFYDLISMSGIKNLIYNQISPNPSFLPYGKTDWDSFMHFFKVSVQIYFFLTPAGLPTSIAKFILIFPNLYDTINSFITTIEYCQVNKSDISEFRNDIEKAVDKNLQSRLY